MFGLSLVLMAAAIQEQPLRLKVFPGGNISTFVSFLQSSHIAQKNIATYVDGVFQAMGPMRTLQLSDGSVKIDPPLPSYIKLNTLGEYAF